MRVLQIDSCCNVFSTGKIAEGIGKEIIKSGGESYIAYGRYANESESKKIKIGNRFDQAFHLILTRLFDKHGFGSKRSTIKFIKKIEKIKPDIIHLHDIHGYYINIEILFEYLRTKNIPVVWTMHSCWAITGHCAHFDKVNCFRWKEKCYKCPQKTSYPASYLFDRSYKNYYKKKSLFTSLNKVKIVAVSNWIKNYLIDSFLNKYEIRVIYNGIDTNLFKIKESMIKEKYGIQNKFIILGVAAQWTERKGLKDFIYLSKYLDKKSIIVLIGLKKYMKSKMPENILGIELIKNPEELADFYSAADVYFNPTWEDTFPTTNLEALSCGTPVITYNTGGSPESIDSETGFVVEKGNVKDALIFINIIKDKGKLSFREKCRDRALKYFDQTKNFKQYIELYKELIDEKI